MPWKYSPSSPFAGAAPAALDQGQAEGVLQAAQHLRDRGLGHVQGLGDFAQGAQFTHLLQQQQVAQAQVIQRAAHVGNGLGQAMM